MSVTTLAIHTEAWLQEELGAQQAILAALLRTEAAARSGASAELELCRHELENLLQPAGTRASRRNALLRKLSEATAIPERGMDLTKLCAHFEGVQVDTQRIQRLRSELRRVATSVVTAGRRLAAMAQYHRGVFEELCQALLSGAPDGQNHLIDARG